METNHNERMQVRDDKAIDLLSKFSPEFKELYLKDPYYKYVFESLIRGADIHTVLEQVLKQMLETNNRFNEYIKYGPPPVYIAKVDSDILNQIINKDK